MFLLPIFDPRQFDVWGHRDLCIDSFSDQAQVAACLGRSTELAPQALQGLT